MIVPALARTLGRAEQRKIYDERMIRLYERQMEAREAMGTRYKCHPSNDVKSRRIQVIKEVGGIVWLNDKRRERALREKV